MPSRRRAPLGLLGTLALIAAVEAFVSRHDDALTTVWAVGWRASGRASARASKDCDLLCLGDSLVKHGVVPRLLDSRLGTRSYNLAACVAQAPTSYFLLRRALGAGARPRTILIDFTEHLLCTGPRKNLRQWPELLGPAEALDLAWTARDASLFATTILGRVLPTVRARVEIRVAIADALAGRPATIRDLVAACRRNWRRNRGAQVNPKGPITADPATVYRQVYPERWRCDRTNAIYIRKFLDLARDHGIQVVWLLPPYTPAFQDQCEAHGVDDQFGRFVHQVQSRYRDLIVLDARRAGFPATEFFDPIHLDRSGASAYTDAIASVLERVPSSRWIALPGPSTRPPADSVEDLSESVIALRAASRR